MGKKKSTIANKLGLLKLNLEVREISLENKLTKRHSRVLLTAHNKKLQLVIVQKVIKDGLNVKKQKKLLIENYLN